MIRPNVQPLIRRLSVLRTKSRDIIKTLVAFEMADDLIPTLTDEQKAAVLADVQTKAAGVADAYADALEAFTADEPVVEPEG